MPNRSPWQDGRRAWTRLNGWHQNLPASPGHPVDADSAIKALRDVALVKHLTGMAEHKTVEAARQGGKSWAAIGAALGTDAETARRRWGDESA
jgi:hypothetical protein